MLKEKQSLIHRADILKEGKLNDDFTECSQLLHKDGYISNK